MKVITNPHDRLFRETWSDRDTAIDFLNHYLPEDVLNAVDLDRLYICKDSFIEKELKDFYSDLLYKIVIKDDSGYVYLFFDHKSWPDKLMPLQLLEYMTKIWRMDLKQQSPGRVISLPTIIPIVLYHGKSGWKYGHQTS